MRIALSSELAADLAAKYDTPLYVYDLDVVDARVAALRGVLPPRVDVAFAVKANPSLGVLTHLARLGIGADVASGGELAAALRSGVPPHRIIFTGPGKRDVELAAAVDAGLRAITVESLGELTRLSQLARSASGRVPVLLRASTGGGSEASIITAGVDKFGMLPDDLETAARQAASDSHLELLGLHAFGASNVLDASVLLEHARATVRRAAEIARLVELPLRLVDIGGGLGIPYADSDPELDLVALGIGLTELSSELTNDPMLADARLLLEPGRFLLGPAGAYLSRVVDVKRAADGVIAVVDGGIHHLLRPALLREEQRIILLAHDVGGRDIASVSVAGPLCTGVDRFAIDARLPTPCPRDLLAVLDTGAYGFTESMPLFLSHPTPAEVALHYGEAQLIRPRMEPQAFLDQQLRPE